MHSSSKTAPYAVSRTATKLLVVAPYNTRFIAAAKAELGGRWNGDAWAFDLRDEADVLELVLRHYGWKPGEALVSAAVFVDDEQRVHTGPFMLLGRVLASASGRDSGAKLGDDVRLRAGGIGSGGSMKNWVTVVREGTELVVHDVPRSMVRRYIEGNVSPDGVRVEQLQTSPVIDHVALSEERERLLVRVAEIDQIVASAERATADAWVS